jgi:excisionase family DNA binding protein
MTASLQQGLVKLHNIDEVAEMLDISRRAVERLVAHRAIACVRIGRSVRFTTAQVETYVASRTQEVAASAPGRGSARTVL